MHASIRFESIMFVKNLVGLKSSQEKHSWSLIETLEHLARMHCEAEKPKKQDSKGK